MLKKMSGLGWQLLWVSIKDDERHNMNPNHSFEDEFEQYCHLRRHSDLEKPCDHCCPLYWRLLVRNYKHCQIQKPTLTVHFLSFEPSQLRVRLGDYDFKKVMIFKSFFYICLICFEVLCLPAYDFGKPGPIKSDVFSNFSNGAGPSSIKKNSGRFLDALREGFKEKNQVKSLVIGQTSLDRPPVWCFYE